MCSAIVVLLALLSPITEAAVADIWLHRQKGSDLQLQQRLAEVSNPSSEAYGKYLSAEEVAQIVGVDRKVAEHFSEVLSKAGYTSRVMQTRDRIEVMLPSDDAVLPHIPSSMAGFVRKVVRRTTGISKVQKQWALTSEGPIGATTMRKAYGIPDSATGSGEQQLVWGPGTYGVSTEDLQKYWNEFRVNNTLSRIRFEGFAGNQTGGDNFGEASLDTDVISSVAFGADTIISNTNNSKAPEEGPGFGYAQAAFLNDLSSRTVVPGVVSLSLGSLTYKSCDLLCKGVVEKGGNYSECLHYIQYDQRQVCMYSNEDVIQTADIEFMKLGLRGVTVLAAAGDGGMHFSFMPFPPTSRLGEELNRVACSLTMPTYPASSPYVTAVGGTQWTGGGSAEEPVYWNGGGSGFSWEFDMPAYQKAAVQRYISENSKEAGFPSSSAFNISKRAYPDLSALANDVGIVIHGKVSGSGGTSAAAPTMAGVVTVLNGVRTAAGKPRLGFWNPALYQAAEMHAGEMFFDVTQGNTRCNCVTCDTCKEGFPAAKGFDLATGWGAPRWEGLVKYFG